MRIRPNYAEGGFYSNKKEEVMSLLADRLESEKSTIDLSLAKKKIIGGIVPHAGHIFCAVEAVHFFEIVRQSRQSFDVIILVNPNHHGEGRPLAIDAHDYWQTSLGKVRIDKELAEASNIPRDVLTHAREHSGEVILPYIQYFLGNDIPILPVGFGAQSGHNAEVVAEILADACRQLNRRPLYIASSDFNHFASANMGRHLDDYALEALLKKDLPLFEERIHERDISICGFGAIMSLFDFARLQYDDYQVSLLRLGHSGEVAPSAQVVNYVSLLLYTDSANLK